MQSVYTSVEGRTPEKLIMQISERKYLQKRETIFPLVSLQ